MLNLSFKIITAHGGKDSPEGSINVTTDNTGHFAYYGKFRKNDYALRFYINCDSGEYENHVPAAYHFENLEIVLR